MDDDCSGLAARARAALACVFAFACAFGAMVLSGPAPAYAAGDPRRGKELAAVWCSACHQIGPEMPPRGPGPPFSAIAGNLRYSARYIKDWVVYPHARMPSFRLSSEVLDDLVAYIHSLRATVPADCEPCSAQSADRRYSVGTGFFIDGRGSVLTVAHNVRACKRITVEIPGQSTLAGTLAGVDGALDLALLRSAYRPPRFAHVRADPPLQLGERVISFSYPLSGTLASSGNLTTGHVAALRGIGDDDSEFQMSANLQLGSSGGPVLDAWARVIGVAKSRLVATAASEAPPAGINFAVSSRALRLFLAAQGHPVSNGDRGGTLALTEVAALARQYTVRVACWR